MWLAFIGWFLLQAAAAEGRYGLLREALGGLYVRDVMVRYSGHRRRGPYDRRVHGRRRPRASLHDVPGRRRRPRRSACSRSPRSLAFPAATGSAGASASPCLRSSTCRGCARTNRSSTRSASWRPSRRAEPLCSTTVRSSGCSRSATSDGSSRRRERVAARGAPCRLRPRPSTGTALEDGRVQCDLCPRACKLREGQRGLCFVRGREGAAIVLTTYGRSSGFCVDPIEKKPLNHFLPGHAGPLVRHRRLQPRLPLLPELGHLEVARDGHAGRRGHARGDRRGRGPSSAARASRSRTTTR